MGANIWGPGGFNVGWLGALAAQLRACSALFLAPADRTSAAYAWRVLRRHKPDLQPGTRLSLSSHQTSQAFDVSQLPPDKTRPDSNTTQPRRHCSASTT
jgi:hypothetical protein